MPFALDRGITILLALTLLPLTALDVAASPPSGGDGDDAMGLHTLTTECFDFASDAEGFEAFHARDDAPVSWDADAGAVRAEFQHGGDRDAQFAKVLDRPLTPDESFEVRARVVVKEFGDAQFGHPLFLGRSDTTDASRDASTVSFGMQSRPEGDPYSHTYPRQFRDEGGSTHLRTILHTTQRELEFVVQYDAAMRELRMGSVHGNHKHLSATTIGTGEGQGFRFDMVGVAASHDDLEAAAAAVVLVDDLCITREVAEEPTPPAPTPDPSPDPDPEPTPPTCPDAPCGVRAAVEAEVDPRLVGSILGQLPEDAAPPL